MDSTICRILSHHGALERIARRVRCRDMSQTPMMSPATMLDVACSVNKDLAFERAVMQDDTRLIFKYRPIGLMQAIRDADPTLFAQTLLSMPSAQMLSFKQLWMPDPPPTRGW